MKNVYLCGHTGSNNRGCEAIIRSTVKILNSCGVENCRLLSYSPDDDKNMHLDAIVSVDSYKYSPKIVRGVYKYVLRDPVRAHAEAHQRVVKNGKAACLLCVGGDTYCFENYYGNYGINKAGNKYKIPTVLWGCSVNERVLTNEFLKADIRKYKYIVARESLTYDILKQCVTDDQVLRLACDPAFLLDIIETELPSVFEKGDTVGINLSPYFIKDSDGESGMIFKNVTNLIRYLLEKTSYNICFIPHVFDYKKENQDIRVINRFYEQFSNEPRIGFLKKDLSCTEIKYVISKCRFFIGARTHSVIAAYSTGVPTLALSYSIKSLGIAKDIFGDYEGYVLSEADMRAKECLTDAFVDIMSKENAIRETLTDFMPQYKQSIINTASEIFSLISKD